MGPSTARNPMRISDFDTALPHGEENLTKMNVQVKIVPKVTRNIPVLLFP